MRNRTALEQQLLLESEAMASYSLASGKPIRGELAQGLNDILASYGETSGDETDSGAPPAERSRVSSGATVSQLSAIHAHLSQLIAPAKPGPILYLQQQTAKAGMFGFLGPVQLTRQMMLVASLFLALLIGTSMSEYVTPAALARPVLTLSGINEALVFVYLMSAAGIGAAFAALFQANRYITEGTFDPTFEPTYWTRLALGVIAGLIISAMVPLDPEDVGVVTMADAAGSEGTETKMSDAGHWLLLAKPALALLGGFSAAAVHRILSRLVDAIESIFRGDAAAMVAAREQLMNARMEGQLTQVRVEFAARLLTLQRSLAQGKGGREIEQHLAGILEDILPSGLKGLEAGGAKPSARAQAERKQSPTPPANRS